MYFRSLAIFGLFVIFLISPVSAFGATISGTLAFDGSPTPESHVHIYNESGDRIEWAGNHGDGNWTSPPLPSGTYYATAFGEHFGMVSELHNGHACPWEACDVTQGNPIVLGDTDITGIAFDLVPEERLWRLRGSIRNTDGHPIGGAVRLYNVLGWPMFEMWTDHDGNFQSEELADGTYFAASVFTDGMLDEAWNDLPCVNQVCNLVQDAAPIIVDGGDVNGLDFVLEPITSGGHISGQVRGPDGPLANVWMDFRNTNGEHLFGRHTDSNGEYVTDLLADDGYFVVAQNEQLGLARELWDDVTCDPPWLCADPWFIRDHGTEIEILGGDRSGIDFDLVMPEGGVISGQMIDAGTGLPVQGVWVVLIRIHSDSVEFLWGVGSDGNGEYFFAGLEAGNYKILAEGVPPGYTQELYGGAHMPCDPASCGDEISIVDETTVIAEADIYLDFEGTRIVGLITRSDTLEPVNIHEGHVGVDLFSINGDFMGGTGVNEFGRYEIYLDGGGEYYLLALNDVEQQGLINEVWDDIPCLDDCYPLNVPGADLIMIGEGETFIADFELDPGLRISGTLVFDGNPAHEGHVNIWDGSGGHVTTAGNHGDGNWSSPPLPPGRYYVTAFGEDFGLVSEVYDDHACPWEACDVTQGDAIVLVDADIGDIAFDLAPEERLWRLRGSVLNSAGHAVGGAVRVFNVLGWHVSEMGIDHNGNFESETLADGTYFAATVYTDGMLDEAWNGVPCVNQVCDPAQDATPIIVDGGDVDGLNFVLEPITSGGHIGGQVKGPAGPLANVMMEIRNVNGDHLYTFPTDTNGEYRTGLLADDSYFVVAQNEQQGLAREVWDDVMCYPHWLCGDPMFIRDQGTAIPILGGDRLDIDFDLAPPPGGMISGQLIDAGTGLPVQGAWMRLIRIHPDHVEFLWGVPANGNGQYYFTGLEPGNYKIIARWPPEGYRPELYGGDYWRCDLTICGTVVNIADDTTVASGKDIYLDFEGTRIVGRITRSDTGEPVSGFTGYVGVEVFATNGDWVGGWGANEVGLYDIRLESGEYYLLAVNDMHQHRLINEVWEDIPCVDNCWPPMVKGAATVTVSEGETLVAHFELTALAPPIIKYLAKIHPTAMVGENSVIDKYVVIHAHAALGIGVRIKKNVEIGAGCVISHLVQIGQQTEIGPDCHVGEGAIIQKEVIIGARAHVGFNSVINKDVRIGDDVHIGHSVTLGNNVVVDAGMCIPDGTVVPMGVTINVSLCH